MMGPGKPSDTQSNFQSRTNFLTTRTIRRGVMVGPDGYLRGSFCPVVSTLTFVPPRSITRTACALTGCLFMTDSLPRTIRRYIATYRCQCQRPRLTVQPSELRPPHHA